MRERERWTENERERLGLRERGRVFGKLNLLGCAGTSLHILGAGKV